MRHCCCFSSLSPFRFKIKRRPRSNRWYAGRRLAVSLHLILRDRVGFFPAGLRLDNLSRDEQERCVPVQLQPTRRIVRLRLICDRVRRNSGSALGGHGSFVTLDFGRQRESKTCASRRVADSPQSPTMRFNDGAADPQAHASAVRLGCKKRIEYLVRPLRGKP